MKCTRCGKKLEGRTYVCKCGDHFLCHSCYDKDSSLDCIICARTLNKGVYVFIDNSNLFIEAKKESARRRHLAVSEDWRVRIDIGLLMEVLLNGRELLYGYIFGSRPPSHDSFWRKYGHSSNCEVLLYDRSKFTNKEKQVDVSLCSIMHM